MEPTIIDNVPDDILETMLKPPEIAITHRDETYMYGEIDLSAADIIIAKKNMETNKVKTYIKAIEDLEVDGWEYLSFITKESCQTRKYRKPV